MTDMQQLLVNTAITIRDAVIAETDRARRRAVEHDAPGGDAQFGIDEIAEDAAWNYLVRQEPPVAVYTEDHPIRTTGRAAQDVLVIDPIDGTRPTVAGLESSMISIASAPYTDDVRLGEVHSALLMEIRTGAWMYSAPGEPVRANGFSQSVPTLNDTADLARMFWSFELNGHPMQLMAEAYGHLVDRSANAGGVFVFNSATFSLTRLLTGQLDAYVDVGNRILRDDPRTESAFRTAGRGRILHLFPYDIAAAATIVSRAGAVVTDAYGADLSGTRLLDVSEGNQQSCVAAANPQLHKLLLDNIRWPATGHRDSDESTRAWDASA